MNRLDESKKESSARLFRERREEAIEIIIEGYLSECEIKDFAGRLIRLALVEAYNRGAVDEAENRYKQ